MIPGFVDPHTHLPFAGYREGEFDRRLAGESYAEIAASGGGIVATVAATRRATSAELLRLTLHRLDRQLLCGTTTTEAKSGYGLDLETELKQLQVLKDAARTHPVEIVADGDAGPRGPAGVAPRPRRLRGHRRSGDLPGDRRRDASPSRSTSSASAACSRRTRPAACWRTPGAWGGESTSTPTNCATWEARRSPPRLGAAAASHLLHASREGIAAMAKAGVIAIALPGVSFFLRDRFAPVRDLVAAGVPVAVATDCNPGSSHTESMPAAIALACLGAGLSSEEALVAATLNAAAALGRADRLGSVEVGKQADLVVLDAPSPKHLVYHFGVNLVRHVVKAGRIVVRDGAIAAQ